MRKIEGVECDNCGPMVKIGAAHIVKEHVVCWITSETEPETTDIHLINGHVVRLQGQKLLDFFEEAYFMGRHV